MNTSAFISLARRACMGAAVLAGLAAPAAWSAGLLDNIKSQAGQLGGGSSSTSSSSAGSLLGGGASSGALGSLGLPSVGGGTLGNAAGVLQYCVQNNYLNAASAQGVKDQLLGKVGLGGAGASQDSGYQQGAAGVLQGSDGSSFSLGNLQDQLKEKACDYVLDNAKSFL